MHTPPKVDRSLTPTNTVRLGFEDQGEEMKLSYKMGIRGHFQTLGFFFFLIIVPKLFCK